MEDDEKIITAWDVLETVFYALILVSAIVAVFATIWGCWYTLKVSLSIIFGLLIVGEVATTFHDKFFKK